MYYANDMLTTLNSYEYEYEYEYEYSYLFS